MRDHRIEILTIKQATLSECPLGDSQWNWDAPEGQKNSLWFLWSLSSESEFPDLEKSKEDFTSQRTLAAKQFATGLLPLKGLAVFNSFNRQLPLKKSKENPQRGGMVRPPWQMKFHYQRTWGKTPWRSLKMCREHMTEEMNKDMIGSEHSPSRKDSWKTKVESMALCSKLVSRKRNKACSYCSCWGIRVLANACADPCGHQLSRALAQSNKDRV